MCDAKGCERSVYHYGHWLCYRHWTMVKNGLNVPRK